MNLEFKVTCNAAFTSGKFASGDDVAAEIISSIEQADPGSMSVGEGEYEVSEWNVEQITQPSRKQAKRAMRVIQARSELIEAVMANHQRGGSDLVLDKRIKKAIDRLNRLLNPKKDDTDNVAEMAAQYGQ